MNKYILLLLLNCSALLAIAQNFTDFSFKSPGKYIIKNVIVEGTYNTNSQLLIAKSGLKQGQSISVPGKDISDAIKKLWKGNFFSDIQILAEDVKGKYITILIKVTEVPVLKNDNSVVIGRDCDISKSEHDDVEDKLGLLGGEPVSAALLEKVNRVAKGVFTSKGYYKATASSHIKIDTLTGGSQIVYCVDKGVRYKINEIAIHGNEVMSDEKIKRLMKETKEKKWWRIWKRSKFLQGNYKEDKEAIENKYIGMAYRDAAIVSDTVYDYDAETINIEMTIDEGSKYYIRSINWEGNVKYSDGYLDTILGIKPGDEYNKDLLDTRLFMNPAGSDVSSLYMDRGHLFFQLTPIETQVSNDSVDLEMRIYEGKVARIRSVSVSGNTKTSDHVILRDLYTQPGELFSRDAVIRSQRQLAQGGYFNPETLRVNPIPNPADGTVDIEYQVEERPSDQIELSGGFGAGRVVGTLGVSFNNFSIKNFFKKDAWQPLPAGDGQKLSIRAQASGYWFQSYNFSFTEPWLGGKKPNAFSVSAFHSQQAQDPKFIRASDGTVLRDDEGDRVLTAERRVLKITGGSVGLGKRLQWPDDNFNVYHTLSYQYYDINNFGNIFSFSNGYANNLSYQWSINRYSLDQQLYPRTGADIKFLFKTTVPYSWFDGRSDYSGLSEQERNAWIEYNKIKFTTSWFTPISRDKKLVFNARLGVGLLNGWSKNKGVTPFERFYLGGSGLTGFQIDGREIIALRAYEDGVLSSLTGDRLISKYTMELRYPVSLNPNATVYVLGFGEAGNSWNSYKKFNPFQVNRGAGVGVRIFLPMFGLLGLDYGWAFDEINNDNPGRFGHNNAIQTKGYNGRLNFTIGMNLGEL